MRHVTLEDRRALVDLIDRCGSSVRFLTSVRSALVYGRSLGVTSVTLLVALGHNSGLWPTSERAVRRLVSAFNAYGYRCEVKGRKVMVR